MWLYYAALVQPDTLRVFPSDIVSDHGPMDFERSWKELRQLFGITIIPSLSYHPKFNGEAEQLNQEPTNLPSLSDASEADLLA